MLSLPVSTAAELRNLAGEAFRVWYLVQFSRIEHRVVALHYACLALCEQGKVTQQVGRIDREGCRHLACRMTLPAFQIFRA